MTRNRIAIILLACCALLGGCQPSGKGKHVHLDGLQSGFPLEKKARMQVRDVRVGRISVLGRFTIAQEGSPSGLRYYQGRNNEAVLTVTDDRARKRLRMQLLVHEGPLEVHLEDGTVSLMKTAERLAPRLVPAQFSLFIPISVEIGEITPCDEITVITYRSIDSTLKRELRRAGQTAAPVSLNEVFDLLLKEEILPYFDDLDPVEKDNECFDKFELFKWLRHEDVRGFEFKEYNLNENMQGLLDNVVDTLIDLQLERNEIKIAVTGYTDARSFLHQDSAHLSEDPIVLAWPKTGIDDWEGIPRPLSVSYGGCSGDRLTGQAPVMIALHEDGPLRVGDPLRSNCELGAVRAYVATVFLAKRLESTGVHYEYGTGGVKISSEADEVKRSVDVSITLKAAHEEEPPLLNRESVRSRFDPD